jgi:hypothetical protein
MRRAWIVATFTLVSCGGGESSEEPVTPAPPPPPPIPHIAIGAYGAVLDDGTPSRESGPLYVGENDATLYAGSAIIGGRWTYTTTHARATLTGSRRTSDDMTADGVAARGSAASDTFELAPAGDNWTGNGVSLTPQATELLPRAIDWIYTRPFTLNGIRETYRMELTTVGDGGIQRGFDTTGCIYSGALTRIPSSTIYSAAITVSGCGPSTFYVLNGNYRGFAFLYPGGRGTQNEPFLLRLSAIDTTQSPPAAFDFALTGR